MALDDRRRWRGRRRCRRHRHLPNKNKNNNTAKRHNIIFKIFKNVLKQKMEHYQ